jgi:hypothetical protein
MQPENDDGKELATPGTVEKTPIELLEERVLRLAIRCDAIEGLFFTMTERVIASLDEAEARKVMEDLRANVMIGEAGLVAGGDWDEAQRIALETEVYATRLLDLIEKAADDYRKAKSAKT